jgi:hypothetical protein
VKHEITLGSCVRYVGPQGPLLPDPGSLGIVDLTASHVLQARVRFQGVHPFRKVAWCLYAHLEVLCRTDLH